MSSQRVLIYLLRRDLRISDNPIFHEISRLSKENSTSFSHILPIYVFAAQQIEVSGFLSSETRSPYPEARSQTGHFWRCGPHRAKFILESVWDLKKELEKIGSGMILRVGIIGEVIKDMLEQFEKQKNVEITAIWMTGEEGVEEKGEERDVRHIAEQAKVDFRLWQDEKYYIDDRDIPFDKRKDYPDVFTSYRKSVEPLREAPREVLPAPSSLPSLPSFITTQFNPFHIPDSYDEIETALLKPIQSTPLLKKPPSFPAGAETAHPFHGGCTAAQNRLHSLIKSGAMTNYKNTRNGLLGTDFSTKLSAWLALGCVSARQIHWQLIDFEDGKADQYKGTEGYGKGENAGTAAVRFELLWRDYMRLCTRKFGPRLFRIEGFRNDNHTWKLPSKDDDILDRLLQGTSGISLIDASQRELFHTGYTSNRARQNVASFFAKHLGLNWKLGAEWYECMLTDYDVSSNWGNWQYVAGVGNDPRGENRIFNPIKQACDYDPKGEYCKAWLPELRQLQDPQEIFQPWKVNRERRTDLGLEGLDMVEKPLKRIDFRIDGRSKGGSGGGRYGGSSRSKVNGYNGESWRGRGNSSYNGRGSNGGYRGRGRGDRSRGQNRQGMMDRQNAMVNG